MIFLGYNDYQPIDSDEEFGEGIIKLSSRRRNNGGGAYGYALSKSAAVKLLEVAGAGVPYAIDRFMIYQFSEVRGYSSSSCKQRRRASSAVVLPCTYV
jgi:hypothetical protein